MMFAPTHLSVFRVGRVRVGRVLLQALFVVAIFTTSLVSNGLAQRDEERPNIEDLLPETTVAFIQIADIRDFVEKAQNGAGMKLLEDEAVAPLYERVVEEGRKAYDKVQDDVGLSLEEMMSIPSGEMVLAVIAPRRKNPVFMGIMEVGEENEAADKAWGVIKDKAGAEGVAFEDEELESGVKVEKFMIDDQAVFKVKHKGLIVACTSEKVLNNFFTRWDGGAVKKVRPLSQNRKFITIMNRCRSDEDSPNDIAFFVDPISLIKSAGRGDMGMQTALALFPAIGLDSILGIGGSMILGEEDYEAIVHGHLLLSNPRKGVTKMIALKPDDYEPETWVPEKAYFYMTTSWDMPQMYDELRGIFDLTMEEGTFDNFVSERIDSEIEMSLEEDILTQLSGRISVSQIGVEPGKANSGSVIFGMGLNDIDESTEMIRKLMDFFNERFEAGFEESEYEGCTYWTFSDEAIDSRRSAQQKRRDERSKRRGDTDDEIRERTERRERRLATVRMPKPTFAIIGSTLVMSDSFEAFEQAVATYKGEIEPLRNSEEFVKMADQMTRLLGTDMPVALSYSNPKHQFEQLLDYGNADSTRDFLLSQSETSEFWGTVKGILDDHDLPPMDVLNKYVVPQGWFVTSDDTGYHMLWFQERLKLEDE